MAHSQQNMLTSEARPQGETPQLDTQVTADQDMNSTDADLPQKKRR